MQQKRIVCIDMGSATIKVAVGVKNANKMELVATTCVAVEGVVRGAITDIEKCTEALAKALREVKAQKEDYIVVGLSNYYVNIAKSEQYKYIDEKAAVEQKDLDELYNKAVDAYLKDDLQKIDVFLRYYNAGDVLKVQNPLGMREVVKLEAIYSILSCRKSLLSNIEKCITDIGFEVSEFVFSSYYAKHILFGSEEKQAGVLILDIGKDITRASVFVENALWFSNVIPFGIHNVTMDIKNSCPVKWQQAESLRRQFGSALIELSEANAEVSFKSTDSWSRDTSLIIRDLSTIVQCRLDEMFRGIRYQLGNTELEDLIESVIVIGGGAQQLEIEVYIQKTFKVPASIGIRRSDLFPDIDEEKYPIWQFANVLGMLQIGLEDTEEEPKPKPKARVWGFIKKIFGGKVEDENVAM